MMRRNWGSKNITGLFEKKNIVVCIFSIFLAITLCVLVEIKHLNDLAFTLYIFSFFTIVVVVSAYLAWHRIDIKIKSLFLIVQFVSLVFVFASVYFYLYHLNPGNYSVSSSIKKGKALNEYNEKLNTLLEIDKKIFFMSEMEANLDVTFRAILNYSNNKQVRQYRINNETTFYFSEITTVTIGYYSKDMFLNFISPGLKKIIIYDKEFSAYEGVVSNLLNAKDRAHTKYFLENIIKRLKSLQHAIAQDLNQNILVNAKLSFLDFYYFSTISMTTTGYGDIIPNSSIVRLIVVTQTFLSVIFLAFGLLLFTREKLKLKS